MSVEKIKPLKMGELADGEPMTDLVSTEANPVADYAALKGIAFEMSDQELIDLSADTNVQTLSFASLVMSKNLVPDDTKTYKISTNHQYINFDLNTVDGTLQIDGDFVIFS